MQFTATEEPSKISADFSWTTNGHIFRSMKFFSNTFTTIYGFRLSATTHKLCCNSTICSNSWLIDWDPLLRATNWELWAILGRLLQVDNDMYGVWCLYKSNIIMKIGSSSAKLCWHLIISRSWTARVPLISCKSGSFLKNPTSFTLKSWQSIVSIGQIAVFGGVWTWTWWVPDMGEALTVADCAVLWVTIFAVAVMTAFIFEVVVLVRTWTGRVVGHFCFFNDVDGFPVNRVLLWHSCVNLIFVLNRLELT